MDEAEKKEFYQSHEYFLCKLKYIFLKNEIINPNE